MSTASGANNTTVSRQVMAETPRRAVTFLTAIAAYPTIRAALVSVGYTQEEHAKGWALLFRVTAFPIKTPAIVNSAVDAMNELELWQGQGFLRSRAALRHLHPEQEAFVFADLEVGRGRESVPAVATFLARCSALENSPDRKAMRKADHAALETLNQRGIDGDVRARLQELVDLASTETSFAVHAAPENVTKREKDIVALHRWLEDWKDTARAVVSQRADLIRLGVTRRRRAKSTDVVPAPVVIPPVVPANPPGLPISVGEEEEAPPSRAA